MKGGGEGLPGGGRGLAVSNGPQCRGAHAGEGLSDRDFTSQDIPVKEVTSSPPNGPENSGSDFNPQFSYQPRRFFWGGGGAVPPPHLRRSPRP